MISERLRAVILRQLRIESFDLLDSTVASTVPGWDSLAHVGILAAIEKEYGFRFRALEVVRLRSVGELQVLVDKKCPPARTPLSDQN